TIPAATRRFTEITTRETARKIAGEPFARAGNCPVMIQLEAKAYGPDSTPAEIEAIGARLSLLRPDVVIYREVPVPSAFQIGVFGERLRQVTAGLDSYGLIMDLTQAKPPGK